MTLDRPAPAAPEPPRRSRRAWIVLALLAAVTAVIFALVTAVMPDRDSGGAGSGAGTSTSAGEVSTDEMLKMWSEVRLPCDDPLVIPGPPQNRYGLVPTADYPTTDDITAELKTITPVGDRAFVADQLSYLHMVLVQTQGDMTITDRDTNAALDAAGSDAARGRDALAIGQAQLLSDRTAYRKAVKNAMTALSTGRAVEDPALAGIFYYGRTCTEMG
jgi:hypothetical protein